MEWPYSMQGEKCLWTMAYEFYPCELYFRYKFIWYFLGRESRINLFYGVKLWFTLSKMMMNKEAWINAKEKVVNMVTFYFLLSSLDIPCLLQILLLPYLITCKMQIFSWNVMITWYVHNKYVSFNCLIICMIWIIWWWCDSDRTTSINWSYI